MPLMTKVEVHVVVSSSLEFLVAPAKPWDVGSRPRGPRGLWTRAAGGTCALKG